MQRANEALVMGLRLGEGVDLARIEAVSGMGRGDFLDARAVARLAGQGLVAMAGDRLGVSDAGILLLDGILAEVARTS